MIRVVALAPYPASAPSTRFRLAQFVAPLRDRGISLEILPFLDEDAYARVYRASSMAKLGMATRGWVGRLPHLRAAAGADVCIVHRELAPALGGGLLRRLARSGTPFVFDFDDAVHLPAPGGHPLAQRLRRPGASTAALAAAAATVWAGNAELAGHARRWRGGQGGVDVVPTVIDTDRFTPAESPGGRPEGVPVVGWIGTHSTYAYLEEILPSLAALRERTPFRLMVVSNRAPGTSRIGSLEIEHEAWSPEAEVEQTRRLDVGLYPLRSTPWELGKCGFKAIQYLACGVPVVASPVGVVPDIVREGRSGFLVPAGGDWGAPLDRLLGDAVLRRRCGQAGRADVEASYSVKAVLPALEASLRRIAGAG